jgi:polyphenol oxidase
MLEIRNNIGWIEANWPAPDHVHAGTTKRPGGTSSAPYDSFNLAEHVGDDRQKVTANRQLLRKYLHLPANPVWLRQAHGNQVINAHTTAQDTTADGSYTDTAGIVCAVLTADCLPLLLCDTRGTEIAAIHIGWRSFSRNIIQNALAMFSASPGEVMAWLGPCISSNNYEVGNDVRDSCLEISKRFEIAFTPIHDGYWQADLARLAKLQLEEHGLENIYGGEYCTFAEKSLFYSYRREGTTGRMASLIWMDSERSSSELQVEY